MPAPTPILGEFETLLLLAILHLHEQKQEAYGSAIRDEIETRAQRAVPRGSIYVTLDRLEEKGLLVHAKEKRRSNGATGRNAFSASRPSGSAPSSWRSARSPACNADSKRCWDDHDPAHPLATRRMAGTPRRAGARRDDSRRPVGRLRAATRHFRRPRFRRVAAARNAVLTRAYGAHGRRSRLLLGDDLRHAWKRLASRRPPPCSARCSSRWLPVSPPPCSASSTRCCCSPCPSGTPSGW